MDTGEDKVNRGMGPEGEIDDTAGAKEWNRTDPPEVKKYIRGVVYPASKRDIVKHAEEHGADENTKAALEALPEKRFASEREVRDAIGGTA